MRPVALCVCVMLSGCFFDEAGPGKKLSDAVTEMNKATRWGQVGMAAGMVDPDYREKFVQNHAGWGSTVQLADSEVLQIEMQPGGVSAVAVISYEWYMTESMTLHQSVVRQRWSQSGDGYALISEVVLQGDPRLFQPNAAPPKAAVMSDPMLGSAE